VSGTARNRFAKKYGQVFLRNSEIAEFEASLLHAHPGSVLEIGPGEGFLTGILLERGFTVVAVEPDHRLASFMRTRFASHLEDGRLTILQESVLDIPPSRYESIIGNIPYMITAPIIFKIFDLDFGEAILMVQKEFADKACAEPGKREAGRISYSLRLRADISYVRTIPRVFFNPVPGVDSAIIRIVPKQVPVDDVKAADDILRRIFSARRKKLGSIFRGIPHDYAEMRGEELTMDKFLDFCRIIEKNEKIRD